MNFKRQIAKQLSSKKMVSEQTTYSASTHKPTTTTKEVTITTKKNKDHNHRRYTFKLKGIWRETQLAKPKWSQDKYVPPYAGPLRMVQKSYVIDPEILMRSNQLCYAQMRTLDDNKRDFTEFLEGKKLKNIAKQEEKTLNSIYFFYKRNLVMKEMKIKKAYLRKAQMAKSSRKKIKESQEQRETRMVVLATPKKSFKAKPPERGEWKPIDQMSRYMDLAEPQKHAEVAPTKNIYQVSPAAKSYIATDNIMKLAQQPKRYYDIEPPLEACRPVPKSALLYKITPQVQKLYVVKLRKEGTTSSPEDEVWKISPGALKYKPSPRILQLAKPIERK